MYFSVTGSNLHSWSILLISSGFSLQLYCSFHVRHVFDSSSETLHNFIQRKIVTAQSSNSSRRCTALGTYISLHREKATVTFCVTKIKGKCLNTINHTSFTPSNNIRAGAKLRWPQLVLVCSRVNDPQSFRLSDSFKIFHSSFVVFTVHLLLVPRTGSVSCVLCCWLHFILFPDSCVCVLSCVSCFLLCLVRLVRCVQFCFSCFAALIQFTCSPQ